MTPVPLIPHNLLPVKISAAFNRHSESSVIPPYTYDSTSSFPTVSLVITMCVLARGAVGRVCFRDDSLRKRKVREPCEGLIQFASNLFDRFVLFFWILTESLI